MDIDDLHPPDDYSHRFFIWHEWIQANGPLTTDNVFDYFATSMFYDKLSNNQVLRMQTMHTAMPILNESEELKRFTGIEFALAHAQPPTLFIIHKRERLSPEQVRPLAAYFIINDRIYQSPDVYTLLSNRLLTSLNSLQSSLDILRKYRPDYTPRTGFVWPIMDTSLPDDADKKRSSDEMLPSSDDGDSSMSVSQKQKSYTGHSGQKKQQNNMLMLLAMRTTAMHSSVASPSHAMTLDGESSASDFLTAGSAQRISVTPAPSATRGATPRIPSSAPTPQDIASTKGPVGGGKKKKKRTSLVP
ncbi:MED6-domain-containing protein [Gyrodon lividus]|nr:MED6-domain-containing protein [Gyrodon lividus]